MEDTVEALVFSARFDDQALAASGRTIVAEAEKTSAAVAAAFRKIGVAEKDLAATLARSGFGGGGGWAQGA